MVFKESEFQHISMYNSALHCELNVFMTQGLKVHMRAPFVRQRQWLVAISHINEQLELPMTVTSMQIYKQWPGDRCERPSKIRHTRKPL